MLTGNDMFYTAGFCPLLATNAFYAYSFLKMSTFCRITYFYVSMWILKHIPSLISGGLSNLSARWKVELLFGIA
ncbi:hypothetical protein BH18THE2_BH18THE2_23640 [soil metagenome]